MFDASKKYPVPYEFLLVQAEFLMSKQQHEKALRLAKLAVTRAPSEFAVWEKLTDIFIRLEDYESALLALNSCPMFTYLEPDAHRFPAPARTHLPLRQLSDSSLADPKLAPNNSGDVHEENDPRENEVHPELRRVPSNSLRGTFLKGYYLLTDICRKVGWDALLKYRARVFVMEDEYRIHRAMAEEEAQITVPAENDGEEIAGEMETISLDDASKSLTAPTKRKGKLSVDELVKKASNNPNLTNAFEQSNKGAAGKKPNNPRLPFTGVNFTFKHKRLCEKWVDNLFMVLYNDLRLYTALKQVQLFD